MNVAIGNLDSLFRVMHAYIMAVTYIATSCKFTWVLYIIITQRNRSHATKSFIVHVIYLISLTTVLISTTHPRKKSKE